MGDARGRVHVVGVHECVVKASSAEENRLERVLRRTGLGGTSSAGGSSGGGGGSGSAATGSKGTEQLLSTGSSTSASASATTTARGVSHGAGATGKAGVDD